VEAALMARQIRLDGDDLQALAEFLSELSELSRKNGITFSSTSDLELELSSGQNVPISYDPSNNEFYMGGDLS
jgi:hypothetical protein